MQDLHNNSSLDSSGLPLIRFTCPSLYPDHIFPHLILFSVLKIEAKSSSEMLVPIYKGSQRHF
jgi:hypothetical protein